MGSAPALVHQVPKDRAHRLQRSCERVNTFIRLEFFGATNRAWRRMLAIDVVILF
jgi:hypothetical protein